MAYFNSYHMLGVVCVLEYFNCKCLMRCSENPRVIGLGRCMEKKVGDVTKKVGELTDKVDVITGKVGVYTGYLHLDVRRWACPDRQHCLRRQLGGRVFLHDVCHGADT